MTATDFETLVLTQWPASKQAEALHKTGATIDLRRAHAIPRRNLDPSAANPLTPAAGHLSLVVMPATESSFPQPDADLRQAIWEFLDERRLLTTRHHVVGPVYVPMQIAITLHLRAGARPASAVADAYGALAAFYDPRRWPFGRNVYVSEIIAELEKLDAVDFVAEVMDGAVARALLSPLHDADNYRILRAATDGATGTIIGIALDEHELVEIQVTNLIAIEQSGAIHEFDIVGMVDRWPLG